MKSNFVFSAYVKIGKRNKEQMNITVVISKNICTFAATNHVFKKNIHS